jgi:peptidoglycan hydrolase CwlO-like protein
MRYVAGGLLTFGVFVFAAIWGWAQIMPPTQEVILTEAERLRAYAEELKRDRDQKELQVSDLRALGAKAQAELDTVRKDLAAAKAAQQTAEAAIAEAQARAAACARRGEGGGR